MLKVNKVFTDVVLVFLLIILKIFHTFFSTSIVKFEQVNVSWDDEVTGWFQEKWYKNLQT